MKNRHLVLLILLLPGASVFGDTLPPARQLPPPDTADVRCLAADRSGCGLLVKRGINQEGYYLTVETGEHGAGSVEVQIRGRSILIGRSEFRRNERTWDRGAYGVVTRSSRSATRLRLPRDADMRRVKREEHDGVITIIVPRLQPVRPGPGYFGYYPYR